MKNALSDDDDDESISAISDSPSVPNKTESAKKKSKQRGKRKKKDDQKPKVVYDESNDSISIQSQEANACPSVDPENESSDKTVSKYKS